MTPRGIRNNNPGNLVKGENWDGLATPEEMTPEQRKETHFCVFRLPIWGIRALAKLLRNYHQRSGLVTVAAMLAKYAPAHENPTSTYVDHVARQLQVGKHEPISVEYRTWEVLVQAVIHFENGYNPYSWEVPAGICMAGIEPRCVPHETRIEYR